MADCGDILQALKDNNLRNYKEIAKVQLEDGYYFLLFSIDIKQKLNMSPCAYGSWNKEICGKLSTGNVPDGSGDFWDTYLVACPHGPPCDKFFELFG